MKIKNKYSEIAEKTVLFYRKDSFCFPKKLKVFFILYFIFFQFLAPASAFFVSAATVSSGNVGSSAALDPVGNKATRLQTQGSSGVDQSSGALTYSYPLTIPDGRNGMSPKLVLSYNSQNNETGWFGYGWNMSIPYIDRTTKIGTDKLYTNPVFMSSLHGEIISSNGSSFEQKIDDGSYAKYAFTGSTWQMTDRDGTIYYFGTTYESRVQDDTGVKIGRWYLNEVRDKFGNGIVYTYTKDGGNIYPSTISYTEHALAHPLNLVTFNLENKTDKSLNYKYGFPLVDTKRVASIKVTTNGKDNSYFTFSYTAGSNGYRSLLQGVEEKHLSTNDDWTLLPKTTFEYEKSSMAFSGTISTTAAPYGSSTVIDTNNDGVLDLYTASDGYFPIDINGDYKKDLIQSDISYGAYSSGRVVNFNYNQGNNVFLSRNLIKPSYPAYIRSFPAGQVIPPVRYMGEGAWWWNQDAVITDVNGDGFDDIVYNDPYGGNGVAINTTNNTFDYSKPSSLWFNITSDQVADINGDGLQDKISKSYTATSTLYSIYLNNGTSYATSTDFIYDAKTASSTFDMGVRFVDINNDGLIDVVRSYTSNYNNPSLCGTLYQSPPGSPPLTSVNQIYINTGSSFFASSSTLSGYLVSYSGCPSNNATPATYSFTREFDSNGDLSVDYLNSTNNTQKQDVLKKVTSSLDSTLDISYIWSTKTGLNTSLPVPMYIVATTTEKLSVSDQDPHNVGYSFSGGEMYFDATNPRDHKFAGFAKVDVVDGKNKTTTYYHQGNGDDYSTGEKGDSYYNIGRAYRTDVYDLSSGSSTLVSKNLSLYTTYSYASSSFTYLDSQVSSVYNPDGLYLSSATKSIFDETKRLTKTSYNYGDIEPFLSFASSTIVDKGTDLVTTQYQYSNLRPQRLVKETSTDYSGKIIINNSYYYDQLPLGLVDKGAVTSIASTIYNPDGTVNATSTTSTAYDSTGNVVQIIDGLNNVTKVIYDSSYFFPVTKIDALNGTTTLTYDPYTLNLLTIKGPDGIKYVKEIDGLGKVTRSYIITSGGGVSGDTRTSYVYGGGLTIYGRRLGSVGESARMLEVYDSYGRLVQSKKETTADSFSTQDTKYDAQSNVISTSLPYITSGYGYTQDIPSNGSVVYAYDGLGRVLTKSVFGTTYSYIYGARNLTVTDNAGTQHKKSYFYDANNNLSQVKEYNGTSTYTTSYNYTPQNKLSNITDAIGNIRNFSYFSNGLLKYQEDTHAPTDTTYTTYSYTYDALGNLLSKTGPLGTLSYTYDAINRPSARVLGDSIYGTSTVSFTYTGCANNYLAPCAINRGTSSTTLTYTTNGKVNSESLSIDGKIFVRSYTYDIYGNPVTITYPDNGKVTYTYSLDGKQTTLVYTTPGGVTKNIVTDSTYNSLNSLSGMRYGNGIQMCNAYTTTSNEGTISPKLQKSVYLFNSTGCTPGIANQIELYKDEFTYKDALTPNNILSTYKDIAGTTHTKNDTLTYDNLVRLTGVSTSHDGGSAINDALVYDPVGNILNQNDVLFRYSADGRQNPNAVTSIGGLHVTYDAQGNRLQSGDSAYTWNALNQMITASSTNGSEIYSYDEQGERIKKVVKATSVFSQKVNPSINSVIVSFNQGDILASVATTSLYVATSTYSKLSALSLLDRTVLTSIVGGYYGSPFTSKFCASASSSSVRQSCIASTTKQLIANNFSQRSSSTALTTGLIDDTIKIVTGALLIPSTYAGLATSSIATSSSANFTVDNGTITSYNTFVATGIVVPISEYSNLPYVSSSTYASLSSVGLNDTTKVRALFTLSGCSSVISSCGTAKKVVFQKYYKEKGYLFSDKALEEMWYVYAAKARLPGNSNEFNASSTVLGSISVPLISGITTSSATSTYYVSLYFNTEYTNQNINEPRLQFFNTVPYFITQATFSELQQAGITQSVAEGYRSLIADLFNVKTASSTEYMTALAALSLYDKKITLSLGATKELYLVSLGAATIPNNSTEYTDKATFDLSSYMSVNSYMYNGYSGTWSLYGSSICDAETFVYNGSSATTRCVLSVSPVSLPVSSSSVMSYILSVGPTVQPVAFPLVVGRSNNTAAPKMDSNNYPSQLAWIFQEQYAQMPASDGSKFDADVSSAVSLQLAGSSTPKVLIVNSTEYTNGDSYPWQATSIKLKAYGTSPHLTLASTTLISSLSDATSSPFTSAIQSSISAYFGKIYDSSSSNSMATSSLVFISPESYAEFASTTLRDSYAISKVFLATSTPQCVASATTTECDKQARKTWFRQVVGNLSGFTPSEAATEEFWMVHKGFLSLPNVIYASTTATTTIAGSYATSTSGTAYPGAYVVGVTPGYYSTYYVATTTATSTGGLITSVGSDFVHTFTSNGVFRPSVPVSASVLVVGGGGSGGSFNGGLSAGGGGAGGYIYSTSTLINSQDNSIVIGQGGVGVSGNVPGATGGDSIAFGYRAKGGGFGGAYMSGGGPGGSGGGATSYGCVTYTKGVATGTPVQGNSGGTSYSCNGGGGGGGAGSVGVDFYGGVAYGGDGLSNDIGGISVTYAKGGAGYGVSGQTIGYGDGSNAGYSTASLAGGNGVVIIRYSPYIPGHWVTDYYATSTTFYFATSTAATQGIFASSTTDLLPVFSRSSLPPSLSTSTSYITATTTVPGYWATKVVAANFPTGGEVTTVGEYRVHKFISSGVFASQLPFTGDVLVIGGGGNGGNGNGSRSGGGGGAGGYVYNASTSISAQTYPVTIGQSAQSSSFGSVVALAGGSGGGVTQNGGAGGSGGGAGDLAVGGVGSSTQGKNGGNAASYSSGGGGGAGGAGSNSTNYYGGNGGPGLANGITGTTVYYAGGGGGAGDSVSGLGGSGGGGNAGYSTCTTGSPNTGGGGGGSINIGCAGGSGVVIIRYLSNLFQATTTQEYIATSTIVNPVTHLELVPPGLLSGSQFNSLYSTSTFAQATSTRTVSEDTYNELLRTPVRINTDVDIIFDYALPFATSTCSGQSATSSCVIGAQKSKVKDTISAFSGFVLSDAALEELYRVKNNELSIVPVSLANAMMSTATQSVVVPLVPSESYVTFATTAGVATSTKGLCSFGVTGSTTKNCYIELPYINSSVSSLALNYTVSPTLVSTSTISNILTISSATTTMSTSTPTITTTTATSTLTGTKSATSTFSFDLTSLYQTFLNSSSPTLTLVPDGNATSSNTYTLGTSTLTITRTITVPKISYAASSLLSIPFSRTTIATTSTVTATSTVDLTSLPPLTFSATFLSPIGRIATTTNSYAGTIVDTTPVSLPTLSQFQLSSIVYPYATSTATSSVNLLTVATTSQITVYTPFINYQDASSTITTYFTLNGTLVGAYTYQKGNEISTGKLTFVHTNYLGTPVLETDTKGDIVQMDITDVFGNYVQRDQRNDNAYHNKGYTSHEFDDVTGLNYVHARYLATPTHSFLSVDPLNYNLPQSYLFDPQQLNTYAYARNNPIIYTDPDGQVVQAAVAAIMLGAIVGGNALLGYGAYTGNTDLIQVGFGLQDVGMIGGSGLTPAGQYNPITASKTNPIEIKSSTDPVKPGVRQNYVDGKRREGEVYGNLLNNYTKDDIIKQPFLRDSNGKKAIDPRTGEGRQLDFVTLKDGKVNERLEVTSLNARKKEQLAKEERIMQNGGTFIRTNSGSLLNFKNGNSTPQVSTLKRLK